MSSPINAKKLRECLGDFKLRELFTEGLGWNCSEDKKNRSIRIDSSKKIEYSPLAEIGGAKVLQFREENLKNFDLNREKVHKEIKKIHNKHILIFSDNKTYCSWSYLSKNNKVRVHDFYKNQNGDFFISKIANIHFNIEDEPKISEIGEKLEKAFDTEKVTKKFYEDFKNNHFDFQKYISGIDKKEDKNWYSSVVLNRLMFIWFLQKKGFVDNNYNYLNDKLEELKKTKKDIYYSNFLKLLFFEGFAKKLKERSKEAKKMLGEIKYLNGGLFTPHLIENKYPDIKIKDKAFEKTFDIFSKYEWHIEDSKGEGKEISPDVLGYIFEKYITEIQQKSMGAYYTKDEITSYLSRNTIEKCILDKLSKKGHSFKTISDMNLNLDTNLCKVLLTNEDSILNTLTILDPAVGSGAFLVSAMKELLNIYSPVIGKIETSNNRDLKNWYENFRNDHKSIPYGIKKNIILKNLYGVDIMKEATEVCKLRLFLSLVSSALTMEELEPLPNMDFNIMHGNSLIGFLKEPNKGQLSLLDKSYPQIKDEYNKLVNNYKKKPLSFDKLKELKEKIHKFLEENNSNLSRTLANKCNEKGLRYPEITEIKGKKKTIKKRSVFPKDFESEDDSKNLNPFHWDIAFNDIIDRGGFDVIVTNPPWDKVKTEDREFFSRYDKSIKKKKNDKKEFEEKREELLNKGKIATDYLKTEEFYQFQRNYFSSFYEKQTGKIIESDGTEKNASSDMNTYLLFTERCFNLLNKNGVIGAVLPSGLSKDDGAIALRCFIFDNLKIESLIDFQNKMEGRKGKIFEGVDSRFKFLILNLKNEKPQDKFPCHFHTRSLRILNSFPNENSMKQSIKEIKELSPRDCQIIEFKNLRDRNLLKKILSFPMLGENLKNSWNVELYREFDEKNDADLFKDKKLFSSYLPLYKGSVIHQFQYNFDLSKANRYIDRNDHKVQNRTGFAFKNKCYENHRLVIRTIASNTNERSLISAVIPKNHFISNSLYGVYINSENPKKNNHYMLFLQAFFNSFIVDYFIRQKVSSNINKKYITPLRIPRLTEKDPYFKEIVKRSALLTCIGKKFDDLADEIRVKRGGVKDKNERLKLQGEIDAMVTYTYGFSLKEFEYILSTFKTGKNRERLEKLKESALNAYQKDKFIKKAS